MKALEEKKKAAKENLLKIKKKRKSKTKLKIFSSFCWNSLNSFKK